MADEDRTHEGIQPEALGKSTLPFATEADLVMKGGITSGIVYPLAIVEIAKAFQLRNIGGTSAGAIAAAGAAAAEVGRQRFLSGRIPKDPGGFDELAKLPDLLQSADISKRRTRLYALFKPCPPLRRLFESLSGTLSAEGFGAKFFAVIKALIITYPITAIIAACVTAAPLAFLPADANSVFAIFWLLVGACVASVGAVVVRTLLMVSRQLPKNNFGFCSGMLPEHEPDYKEALTVWLADYLDALSGQAYISQNKDTQARRKPLTFGDLKAEKINLEMITTCVTFGRPFRLPFRDDNDVRENKGLYYRESELRQYFPPYVVDWMKDNQRPQSQGHVSFENEREFLRLPSPDDLPVVFAARMSLSFPILLSAIRLYAIDFTKPVPDPKLRKPEPCWFTDGGISSNFPIHFFDSALPGRPTFGIDLGETEDASTKRVVFPKSNRAAFLSAWHHLSNDSGFDSILSFLLAILDSARNWSHETLAHMPGFRDRIATILLTNKEGGLNLTMNSDKIAQLSEYGRQAGREFVRRFGNPAYLEGGLQETHMNWENHQSIRLRILMATITELTKGMAWSVKELGDTSSDYGRLFKANYGAKAYQFKGVGNLDVDPVTKLPFTQAGLCKLIYDALLDIANKVDAMRAVHPDVDPVAGSPRPTPELKPRPRI